MNSNQDQDKEENNIIESLSSKDNNNNEQVIETEDQYKFGWNYYSELTNGRFAMLGFLAIILIELFSQTSFLNWAGIL